MLKGKNLQKIGYRRIIQLLVGLQIVPTVVLLSLGLVLLGVGEARGNLLLGLVLLSFLSVLVTGTVLVLVFVRRQANLSELQADFVSKVSHELRTPLTAIRLFAETLERARQQETHQQCIAALNRETKRLTRQIERLLDWGRMEAGRKLYERKPHRLRQIIEEAVGAFSPLPSGSDVDFRWEVEGGTILLWCDRPALVEAVVNLLSNAYKYGGTPGWIRLYGYQTPKEVCVEVRDNGEGIARPEQRRIFEKFYRIDDRLSRTREGSGLGLAIVKHVVRAHHGRVMVESSKGAGSTFRLLLPKTGA